MDLPEIESTIERVLECSESVKEGINKLPLYSYFHQGTEFTYVHTTSTSKNTDLHRILIGDKPVLDVDFVTKQISYIIDGVIVRHELDILEEWHFQLSTVEPLISYEHIQMVKSFINLINK